MQRYNMIVDDISGRQSFVQEIPDPAGKYVLFDEAEADKAEAVADATAELRAELVRCLEILFMRDCMPREDGWLYTRGRIDTNNYGRRLVAFGGWKHLEGMGGTEQFYRPIEPQDSEKR